MAALDEANRFLSTYSFMVMQLGLLKSPAYEGVVREALILSDAVPSGSFSFFFTCRIREKQRESKAPRIASGIRQWIRGAGSLCGVIGRSKYVLLMQGPQ